MDFRRLFDLFPYQQAKFPQKVALAQKKGFHWITYTTQECIAEIDRISAGLIDLGLHKGDKVGIMTQMGSPPWNFLDMAMQQLGIVVIPIHASIKRLDLEYILDNAGIKYCFVANRELYEKVSEARRGAPILKEVFTLEPLPDVPNWRKLVIEPTPKHREVFQGLKASIHEDDIATIIYTSGTTGTPKGVMLSHKNIISNIKATISLVPVNWEKTVFSFLPLSHIFERMVVYTYIAVGASLYYAERRDAIWENMREIRPHFFTAVPRIVEGVFETIVERASKRSLLPRKTIFWAIRTGEQFREAGRLSIFYKLKRLIASILVYRVWRRRLGNRIEGIVVGAAALQPKLGRLFSAAKLPIREGYGLTETSPVISFNRFEPGGVRFGTVGIPIPGLELNIDKPNEEGEGEIIVRGPNVMLGYFEEEEATRKVLTEDGWFKTGDIGKIIHKRFLKITDRKKDIFKTTSGKYVAPQALENRLHSSNFIQQSMIIGFNRPYVTALIIPSFPILKSWCLRNNVHWTAPQFMVLNPKVIQLIQREVDRFNESLESHQRIRRFQLLYQEWSEERGELTSTMKPRRAAIEEKYKKEIEEMYA